MGLEYAEVAKRHGLSVRTLARRVREARARYGPAWGTPASPRPEPLTAELVLSTIRDTDDVAPEDLARRGRVALARLLEVDDPKIVAAACKIIADGPGLAPASAHEGWQAYQQQSADLGAALEEFLKITESPLTAAEVLSPESGEAIANRIARERAAERVVIEAPPTPATPPALTPAEREIHDALTASLRH
jgi:hypothetical protein